MLSLFRDPLFTGAFIAWIVVSVKIAIEERSFAPPFFLAVMALLIYGGMSGLRELFLGLIS